MRKLMALFLLSVPLLAAPKPRVKLSTSMGEVVIQLEPDAAPKTVANFLNYVHKGFYNGTIFHRVIPNFMIQGGGHLPDLKKKPADSSITNEADLAKGKGLLNTRGTITMALPMGNPYGATSQFFINVQDNPKLNFKAKTMTDFGYCPFGKVVQGMQVVDQIRRVPTKTVGEFQNVPVKPVVILKAEEVK